MQIKQRPKTRSQVSPKTVVAERGSYWLARPALLVISNRSSYMRVSSLPFLTFLEFSSSFLTTHHHSPSFAVMEVGISGLGGLPKEPRT